VLITENVEFAFYYHWQNFMCLMYDGNTSSMNEKSNNERPDTNAFVLFRKAKDIKSIKVYHFKN